jgi:hypothetical protein
MQGRQLQPAGKPLLQRQQMRWERLPQLRRPAELLPRKVAVQTLRLVVLTAATAVALATALLQGRVRCAVVCLWMWVLVKAFSALPQQRAGTG